MDNYINKKVAQIALYYCTTYDKKQHLIDPHYTAALQCQCLQLICSLCAKMKCTSLCILMACERLSKMIERLCFGDDNWNLKLVSAYRRCSSIQVAIIMLMDKCKTVNNDNLLSGLSGVWTYFFCVCVCVCVWMHIGWCFYLFIYRYLIWSWKIPFFIP